VAHHVDGSAVWHESCAIQPIRCHGAPCGRFDDTSNVAGSALWRKSDPKRLRAFFVAPRSRFGDTGTVDGSALWRCAPFNRIGDIGSVARSAVWRNTCTKHLHGAAMAVIKRSVYACLPPFNRHFDSKAWREHAERRSRTYPPSQPWLGRWRFLASLEMKEGGKLVGMTWDETFLERGWTFAGMTTGGGTFFERGWDALRMAEGEAYGETTLGGGTCVVAGRKAAFALQPASRTRRNCLQRKAPPRGMAPFCDAVCPFSRSSRPAHVRPGRRLRQWPCPCRSTCSRRACRRRRPCPPSRQAPRTARTARCCARR